MTRVAAALALTLFVTAIAVGSEACNSDGAEDATRPESASGDPRQDALVRAQVWERPRTPVGAARLLAPADRAAAVECRFVVTDVGGTAPKFDCELDTGERIRVKYGRTPEIPGEVAATRLLRALGFAADDVRPVERLVCRGCPAEPFLAMKAAGATRSRDALARLVDFSASREFHQVAVERRHPGRAIRGEGVEGWAFFELDAIDPAQGGAPRAHVDALRLLAVFLAHWDNKSENQRLVCLDDGDLDRPCQRPLAMLQDLGATFGPRKVDLPQWERAPMWTDRGRCLTDMRSLPHDGATFAPVVISEAGRRHLAGLLGQLSPAQIADLFTAARFDASWGLFGSDDGRIGDWVRVFQARVAAINDGPPCPS